MELFLHGGTIAHPKVERAIFYERSVLRYRWKWDTLKRSIGFRNFWWNDVHWLFNAENEPLITTKWIGDKIEWSVGMSRFLFQLLGRSWNIGICSGKLLCKVISVDYVERMIDGLCNKGPIPIAPYRGLKGFGVGVTRDKVNVFALHSITFIMESNIC